MRTAHSGYLRAPLVCVFLLTGFDPALAQQTGTPTAFEPIEFRSPGAICAALGMRGWGRRWARRF